MNHVESGKRSRPWLPFLLVLLPLWLVVSAGIGIWMHFRSEEDSKTQLDLAFSRMVSAKSMADDLAKLTRVIGERHTGSETAGNALDQAARMIEGSLGPSNTGLEIRRLAGPGKWPILLTTIPGDKPKEAAVWMVAGYDSRPGSIGMEANATGTAAVMAATQALVANPLDRTIHIAFVPHASDPEAPLGETMSRLVDLTKDAHVVLCVEAMGAGQSLWVTARDAGSPVLAHLTGLGEAKGAEVICLHDDNDPASILFASGAPAVRIATRTRLGPEDPDEEPVDPANLAASTGRLVTLVQRLATMAE